jgi:hypothetical protein
MESKMDTTDNSILLRKIVTKSKSHVDACLKENVGVICSNKMLSKRKVMPFRILYENNSQFWLQNEVWEYFLAQDDLAKIEERVLQLDLQWSPVPVETVQEMTNDTDSQDNGFGDKFAALAGLSPIERFERMRESKKRLEALITQKTRHEKLVTSALVETAEDTILHNYISINSAINLAASDPKQQTMNVVESTHDIVKASSKLVSEYILNDELMNTLVAKSNGTIIQHMTRVYLKGLAFLSYYNKLVTGTSIIKKLRVSFGRKYHSFYRFLLPHIDPDSVTLERVFMGGMRAIAEPVFYDWATGFLLHDIGKASAVEYHAGEGAYNRDIVMEHVKVGYNGIINKTNYPPDAALITGHHHEYYGHPSGYGNFRLGLEQYKKINPKIKQDYCIAYETKPVLNYQALTFFPAKLLEIVDVFDSLTDPNRKYRKAMTTEEALAMTEEEFIKKSHKIDPILFDLFAQFIRNNANIPGDQKK